MRVYFSRGIPKRTMAKIQKLFEAELEKQKLIMSFLKHNSHSYEFWISSTTSEFFESGRVFTKTIRDTIAEIEKLLRENK